MLRAMAEAARQRRLFQALFMIRVLVMFFFHSVQERMARTGTDVKSQNRYSNLLALTSYNGVGL